MVKLAAALHTNLDVAMIDDIGPNDWNEPADVESDSTIAFNCLAHNAQLAASDVLDSDGNAPDSYKSLVVRVRAIVTLFNKSALKATALSDAQKARNRKVLAVVRDVKTRWLSLHAMLERFVEIYHDILYLTMTGQLNPERAGPADDERANVNDFITPDECKKVTSAVCTCVFC